MPKRMLSPNAPAAKKTLMNSDFLILVLYDFIVQNFLSSLLLLCYNLMIMNHYE
jgi:hypothetical protein